MHPFVHAGSLKERGHTGHSGKDSSLQCKASGKHYTVVSGKHRWLLYKFGEMPVIAGKPRKMRPPPEPGIFKNKVLFYCHTKYYPCDKHVIYTENLKIIRIQVFLNVVSSKPGLYVRLEKKLFLSRKDYSMHEPNWCDEYLWVPLLTKVKLVVDGDTGQNLIGGLHPSYRMPCPVRLN